MQISIKPQRFTISLINGLAKFLKSKKYRLIDVMLDKNIFKELIIYLKIEYRLKYTDILSRFEASKSIIETIKNRPEKGKGPQNPTGKREGSPKSGESEKRDPSQNPVDILYK